MFPALAVRTGGLLVAACAMVVVPRSGRAQTWTDWTARTLSSGTTNGTATGTLQVGASTVSVAYTGDVHGVTQLTCGTDYWATNSAIYTSPANGLTQRPTGCDIVTLVGGAGRPVTQTLTFGQALVNPVMAILSQGQPNVVVRYNFNTPFDVLNSGTGFWGGAAGGSLFEDAGNVLRGIEGHGLIRFNGTVSSISWTVPDGEDWHGFTVGAAATVVPEPATVSLLAAGLGALALGVRRRTRR